MVFNVRTPQNPLAPQMEESHLEPSLLEEQPAAVHANRIVTKLHPFEGFDGTWLVPRKLHRQGVVLYLYDAGGNLKDMQQFGSAFAYRCGVRVFCCACRLTPEHPFSTVPEDALEAYRYLLEKGYRKIALFGRDAGGYLCYALCLRLKELKLPMPCSIQTISPWANLMTSQDFCKEAKTVDLQGMPPSLIFVDNAENMHDDSQLLHEKLLQSGCRSSLVMAPNICCEHTLSSLAENQDICRRMNAFLNCTLSRENKLRWVRLDNAAKIYPAARRQNWSNVFRLSAALCEPVDAAVLKAALDVTVPRFPTIAARLRRGSFWYYLQQLSHAPELQPEYSYPLARMNNREMRNCAFRVIAHENRIAVEFFHSLTDGNGGLVFLKTLLAEYLQEKYGLQIPTEQGILGRLEEPDPGELEDSFLKYASSVCASRKESNAWRPRGTPTAHDRLNFAMYTIPEADPRLGEYSFPELCKLVQHKMGTDITPKHMSKMISTNVRQERCMAVRLLPLPVKNLVMKAVFDAVGERKSCLTLSNLGAVTLPEAMKPYISRMDFILGVQATAPYNCGVVSWGDTLYINFIRNIRESDLERHFFQVLRELGLPVTVESNLS